MNLILEDILMYVPYKPSIFLLYRHHTVHVLDNNTTLLATCSFFLGVSLRATTTSRSSSSVKLTKELMTGLTGCSLKVVVAVSFIFLLSVLLVCGQSSWYKTPCTYTLNRHNRPVKLHPTTISDDTGEGNMIGISVSWYLFRDITCVLLCNTVPWPWKGYWRPVQRLPLDTPDALVYPPTNALSSKGWYPTTRYWGLTKRFWEKTTLDKIWQSFVLSLVRSTAVRHCVVSHCVHDIKGE